MWMRGQTATGGSSAILCKVVWESLFSKVAFEQQFKGDEKNEPCRYPVEEYTRREGYNKCKSPGVRCLRHWANNKEANAAETQGARGQIRRNKVRGLAKGQNHTRSLGLQVLSGFYLAKAQGQDGHDLFFSFLKNHSSYQMQKRLKIGKGAGKISRHTSPDRR